MPILKDEFKNFFYNQFGVAFCDVNGCNCRLLVQNFLGKAYNWKGFQKANFQLEMKDWDMSLMLCIVESLKLINQSDIAILRQRRNFLAHVGEGKLDYIIFHAEWNILKNVSFHSRLNKAEIKFFKFHAFGLNTRSTWEACKISSTVHFIKGDYYLCLAAAAMGITAAGRKHWKIIQFFKKRGYVTCNPQENF